MNQERKIKNNFRDLSIRVCKSKNLSKKKKRKKRGKKQTIKIYNANNENDLSIVLHKN